MEYNLVLVVVKDNLKSPVCKHKCFFFQIRPPISFVENHMQDFFSFICILPFEPLMNEEHDVQKKVCQRKPFFFHNSKDLNLAVLHEKSVKWWGKRRVSFLFFILPLFCRFLCRCMGLDAQNSKHHINIQEWIRFYSFCLFKHRSKAGTPISLIVQGEHCKKIPRNLGTLRDKLL